MLIVFLIFITLILLYIYKSTNDIVYRWFGILFILGFTFYSGIGIFTQSKFIYNNKYLYLFQFITFLILFLFSSFVARKFKISNYKLKTSNLKDSKLVSIMACIYILTFVIIAIYSGVKIQDFISVKDLFSNYKATPFYIREMRRNSNIYKLISNQIRTLSMPFYFVYLYKIKDNKKLFLLFYLAPILLELLADRYLSRNKIAVHIVFIFIYLIHEKIISYKTAKKISVVFIPASILLFAYLGNIRSGDYTQYGFFNKIANLVINETGYPKYYNICNIISNDISAGNFILYIIFAWVPSQFYNIIGIEIPNLAYSLTKAVTGLSYAQTNNYYILLPSVLGEAIMLFGKYWAFLYGIVYGILSTLILKFLKTNNSFFYLMVFYILDFFRQFRGGSQYVISIWIAQLVPFIVLILIRSLFLKNKRIV